jgi:thymidylate synthase
LSKEIISQVTDETFLVTSYAEEKKILEQAMYDYTNKSNFRSTYFNEGSNNVANFKIEDIDRLALNAQSNLNNIIQINNIVRYFVNKNDILGKVFEAIETNVNSDYTLTHPKYNENEKELFDKIDELIVDFNEKINLRRLIVESIPMAYIEGNYAIYLRKEKKGTNYQVDYYPLGVVEVSDYEVGGEPYLLINIRELESRLRKTYTKNRKNKALFYENMEQEIKDTYPSEVLQAYMNKEQFAKLSVDNSGLIRINNLKRRYGLNPIFKALKSVIRLENIELSDDKNTLVRGKKIIFQKLAKELVTQSKDMPNITWSSAQAKAHTDLMAALSSNGVSVYTGLPWTESVSFIEPKLEQTNVQVKNKYREDIMTSVGIAYLISNKGGFGSAQLSIQELMKMINKISEQLEAILMKWYRGLLIRNNIDPKYCPKIKVIDSEKLSTELAMALAKMLNNEVNASLETVYQVLGLDVRTEELRRKREKELGYDETFKPRKTSYTNNSDDEVGRPSDGENTDKVDYDKTYNEDNGR